MSGVSSFTNKGKRSDMSKGNPHTDPADAPSSHEWEADAASELVAGFMFWCWYLPAEALGPRLRAVLRALAHGRVMLRYPVNRVPIRRVSERVPVRPR
jgi:hypothetical protein